MTKRTLEPAVLAELETSPGGLSGEQARERPERAGPNEIAEERKSALLVLPGVSLGADPVDDRGRAGAPVPGPSEGRLADMTLSPRRSARSVTSVTVIRPPLARLGAGGR